MCVDSSRASENDASLPSNRRVSHERRISCFGIEYLKLDKPKGEARPVGAHSVFWAAMQNHNDPLLGQLKWDPEMKSYVTQVESGRGSVEFEIEVVDERALDAQLGCARRIAAALEEYSERARQFAARQMLGLKNGGWLDKDEAPITEEEFRSRIQLSIVEVLDQKSTTLILDDGDVFWGHQIAIGVNADGEPTSAVLATQ
jgi:hypothetical protein